MPLGIICGRITPARGNLEHRPLSGAVRPSLKALVVAIISHFTRKLRETSLTAPELHCHCRLDIWDYSKLWHHLIWLGGNHNHSHCALLYETCHILDVVMRNKLERGKHFCIKFHESFWLVGDEELSTQSPSLLTSATNIAANLLPGLWQNFFIEPKLIVSGKQL